MKIKSFPAKKSIALLLDPDKAKGGSLQNILKVAEDNNTDYILAGGITDRNEVKEIFNAGADLIILGNGCEKDPDLLANACRIRDEFRKL